MKKIVNALDNFTMWESYEVMMKYKNIITTFIANDITKDSNCREYLVDLYVKYKEYCYKFYNNLNNIYVKYFDEIGEVQIDFEINYIIRIYELKANNKPFDLESFAMNNLALSQLDRGKLTKVLYGRDI